jgi:hypothetical protein
MHKRFYPKLAKLMVITMSRTRLGAVFAVVLALAVLLAGLYMVSVYSAPQLKHEYVYSETFTMQANTTTHRSLTLNSMGIHNPIVYVEGATGTVFSSSLSDASLEQWLQGNFNVSWDGTSNMVSMSGNSVPCKVYWVEVADGSAPMVVNIVFWNPETFSLQVNLVVDSYWSEVDIPNQNLAKSITALGATAILLIAALLAVKNRAQLKNVRVTRRMALALVVAVVMIVLGVFLAVTYSNIVEAENLVDKGTITVPANDYKPLSYQVSADGAYAIQLDVDKGTIQGFYSSDGSIMLHWSNGTTQDRRLTDPPTFNGSSGMTGGYYNGDHYPTTRYLVLSNVDSYDKQVQYTVTYHWTYYNYFAMIAGITLFSSGAIVLALTLLKNRLHNFNKALENQQ